MRISLAVNPAPTDTLDEFLAAVARAASAGVARVWTSQMPPVPGLPSWELLTALALAGRAVPGVGLGAGVVVAQTAHPLVLARAALTTTAAVGDRLTLGVGLGHPESLAALGIDYRAPVSFLREYLDVLVPALAGRPVDHRGALVRAQGQVIVPGAPVPRLVLAALGPRMLALAAEVADGTITTWAGARALGEHVVPTITAAARAAGRPEPQVIASLPVALTDAPDAARAGIASAMAIAERAPSYQRVLALGGASGVADVSLVGDEATLRAEFRRLADAGVTEFAAAPFGDPATVARTADLVAALAGEHG